MENDRISKCYTVTKLNENDYLIQGSKHESMYLLVGDDQALLVDTGMEDTSLMEQIRKITDKPVVLALTHGHLDHIGRSAEFDQVYLDDKDRGIYMMHTNILAHMSPDGAKNTKQVESVCSMPKQFHLGNLDVDVVNLQGHTPGSVILIDRKNQCVFTGDAIGSGDGVVLAVQGAMRVSDFRDGLVLASKELTNLGVTEQWRFFGGHRGKECLSKVSECNLPDLEMLHDMITLCDEVIDGTAKLENREGSPFDPHVPSVYAAYNKAEMHFFR